MKNMVFTLTFTLIFNLFPITAFTQSAAPNLPTVPGYSYAVLVVPPNTHSLNTDQVDLINNAKQVALNSIPALLTGITGTLGKDKGAKEIFSNSAQILKDLAIQEFGDLDSKLTRHTLMLNLYLVLWPIDKIPADAQASGQPFPVIEIDLSTYSRPSEFYNELDQGRFALENAYYKKPGTRFYVYGANFNLRLEKTYSEFTFVFAAGLNPGEYAFSKENDQVSITQFIVPDPDRRSDRPYTLVNVNQKLSTGTNPTMLVEFGGWGGFNNQQTKQGRMQILDQFGLGPDSCDIRTDSTPYFAGNLKDRPTGKPLIDSIVGGWKANFRVFAIPINPQTQRVENMDVRLGVSRFQCNQLKQVSDEFTAEVNSAIQEQLDSLYSQDDMTDDILDDLYSQ